MKFSRRVTLAGVAVAALAAGPVAASMAAGAAHRVHTPRSATGRIVHVIEHAVTDTVVQSGGSGDATGNTLTFHNKVYNTANKKIVGHDQGFCIRIYPKEGSWECYWTTFLAGGQITVEGPYYDKKNSELAITGGTARYAKVRGEMDLLARDGGKEYDFVFHLA